jgi:hypothetical protein
MLSMVLMVVELQGAGVQVGLEIIEVIPQRLLMQRHTSWIKPFLSLQGRAGKG